MCNALEECPGKGKKIHVKTPTPYRIFSQTWYPHVSLHLKFSCPHPLPYKLLYQGGDNPNLSLQKCLHSFLNCQFSSITYFLVHISMVNHKKCLWTYKIRSKCEFAPKELLFAGDLQNIVLQYILHHHDTKPWCFKMEAK